MFELKSKLVELGLSEKEASVYLAMLELGSQSVQEIAKKADVNRVTTYVLLDSLKNRGLVSSIERDKKVTYVAESPEHLLSKIDEEAHEVEKKKQCLLNAMPQFMGLFNAIEDKPKVRFFEGEEGVVACRSAQLELSKNDANICVFIHYDQKMVEAAKTHEAERIKITERRINTRLLYSIDPGLELPSFGKYIQILKIPDGSSVFHGELAIFEKFILVATVKQRPIGVIIENEEVSKLFKALFDLSWERVKNNKAPF